MFRFQAPSLEFNEANPNKIWRDSLIACLAGLALFSTTVAIDVGAFYGQISLPVWLSVGGPDDARAILSSLLSSVSAVLALMFTVIMLVLSIAATWFGPRLMTRFIRQSHLASWMLGLFLASFVQCVLTLIAMRERQHVTWIPEVTILTTIALVVFSFFALVYFCHRMAEAIQISNVLAILVKDLRLAIRNLPATTTIDPAARRIAPVVISPPVPQAVIDARNELCERQGAAVHASRSGYLQEVRHLPLFLAADRADAVVRLLFRPGQFVAKGSVLAYVLPAERSTDFAQIINRHHVLGRQRTLKQDLEFGIAQLVEIALRSLSSAFNDAYTATYCVDWLGDALLELAAVRPSHGAWTTPEGAVRLLEPPASYSRFVKAAFNQIRQAAPNNPALTIRLFQTFTRMTARLTDEAHRQAVQIQVEALWDMASSVPMARADRRDIEAAYQEARGTASPLAVPPAVAQVATVVPLPSGLAPR